MTSILTRRSFLRGIVAAPAIVCASNLMPVRRIVLPEVIFIYSGEIGRFEGIRFVPNIDWTEIEAEVASANADDFFAYHPSLVRSLLDESAQKLEPQGLPLRPRF